MQKNQIALQVWTIDKYWNEDCPGALAKIAEIGYSGIEFGGTANLSFDEFRGVLSRTGLTAVGRHIGICDLENNLNKYIDENLAVGAKYIICPMLDEARRQGQAGYKQAAETLNEIGAKLAESDLIFCYHNHNFEFEMLGDITAYEFFFRNLDPKLVKAELDVYWATFGNQDPIELIRKVSDRLPLLHIKDMDSSPERFFTEVGEGVIDMPAVVSAGDAAGVEWFIVEQDQCRRDPLESIEISYKNILELCQSKD